jgi:hypothetical protein
MQGINLLFYSKKSSIYPIFYCVGFDSIDFEVSFLPKQSADAGYRRKF